MIDELLPVLDFICGLNWTATAVGLLASGAVLLAGRGGGRHRRDSGHPFAQRHPHLDPFRLCVSERREKARCACRSVPVEVEADRRMMQGWVQDRSMDGLAIALPGPVRIGGVVHVRRMTASRRIPLRVSHCRSVPSGWVIGGAFHAAPSSSGLLFE